MSSVTNVTLPSASLVTLMSKRPQVFVSKRSAVVATAEVSRSILSGDVQEVHQVRQRLGFTVWEGHQGPTLIDVTFLLPHTAAIYQLCLWGVEFQLGDFTHGLKQIQFAWFHSG